MSERQLISGINDVITPTEEREYSIDAGNGKYFKLFVRQPTWLEKQNALSGFFSVDTKTRELSYNLSEYYKRILTICVRTEPAMNVIDLMKVNTFVGSQIEKHLPLPGEVEFSPEEEKK